MKTRYLLLLIVPLAMFVQPPHRSFAQGVPGDSSSVSSVQCKAIFEDVQSAISSGNVALLSRHFAPQVDISLRGGESGTFSSKQAFYVFESFFRTRRFSRLRFSTAGEIDSNPYATGSTELLYKGNRELVQVYVALTNAGEKHLITQLNIY